MGRSLYPLKGLPKQGQLWSWIAFDIANQSFTLIINTLLFSIFFAQVVVRNDSVDDSLWALTFGSSMLLTALVSPLAGAAADERAWKKRCLIGSGLICGVFTCGLALVEPGQIWLAVMLYIPANFAFAIGENFLASFLPSLARQDELGRVSGFSWACAYASALLLLVLTFGAMILFGWKQVDQWRPFFVFSGLWFLVFLIPAWIWLKEPPAPPVAERRNLVAAGFSRLKSSLRHASSHRDLMVLLVASLFYGTGMNVVVFFASKLADEYGFTEELLVGFVAVITVSGVIGTLIPMLWQDRFGHRRSTLFFLYIWLFTSLSFALYARLHDQASVPEDYPTWPLWVIGNLLGFGLGALGSANRAFVGYLAPEERLAETYGLWGMVWKLSALTTFPFAWIKDRMGTPQALVLLAAFIVVGLVLTLLVDEKRGHVAAAGPNSAP